MKYDDTLREDFQTTTDAADGDLSTNPIAIGDAGVCLQLKP
jgi:hypothetical protein